MILRCVVWCGSQRRKACYTAEATANILAEIAYHFDHSPNIPYPREHSCLRGTGGLVCRHIWYSEACEHHPLQADRCGWSHTPSPAQSMKFMTRRVLIVASLFFWSWCSPCTTNSMSAVDRAERKPQSSPLTIPLASQQWPLRRDETEIDHHVVMLGKYKSPITNTPHQQCKPKEMGGQRYARGVPYVVIYDACFMEPLL